ncbi:hypothetical protein AWB75_03665 [Caballeronia catudaia]|uniref:Uncharacterized protein n=1 Tax=Caballeronia catudaia TaxID=1777136 RepID=A0A158BLG6_9BURK|nr:hypothetical protein AWB75_03665 [Caballeronia catudaia]
MTVGVHTVMQLARAAQGTFEDCALTRRPKP